METDWQSWAALIIVGITMLVFAVRAARKGEPGGCGGSCGCDVKNKLRKHG